MDFKSHFNNIHSFLSQYERLWHDEVLNFYPHAISHYDPSWINELKGLDDNVLWQIDCKNDPTSLEDTELSRFIKKAKSITCLNSKNNEEGLDTLPEWAFKKVKEKKRHEILIIAKKIQALSKKHNFSHIVDIGGGVGHLSRILSHYYGHDCISLDQNNEFQEIGKKRLIKYPRPKEAGEVNFVNLTFGASNDEHDLKNVFAKTSLSLGLHTCGPLAVRHIQTNLKYNTKGLINFGCCYNKIESSQDVNLSNYAKTNPLSLSKYALTLATRGHNDMNYEEFLLKKRVKYYRYALHLLLYKKLGQKEFMTAGEANAKLYWQNFSVYANEKLNILKIEHNLSPNDLDEFFNSDEVQKEIETMFLANIIRWQFGRVVEHYILTDRCLFLEEKGLDVKMEELFDNQLSPRNIGITAILPIVE